MQYWPSSPWRIQIAGNDTAKIINPERPFALIGSHPACSVRIQERRVPPVAYIACCFEDSVEAWPLCPIAFPRWGICDHQHELIVGRTRINLVHPTHHQWSEICPDEPPSTIDYRPSSIQQEPHPIITLQWDRKLITKPLYRRVTIVGNEHPSTLRLHGQGLETCDHAIISVDQWTGLIDLNPRPDASLEELVHRLGDNQNAIQIAKISLCDGAASRLMKASTTIERESQSNDKSASMLPESSETPEETILDDEPELLASKVTDRLVSIDQAKFTHRRMVLQAAYIAGFLCAGLIIIWVIVTQLIPLIQIIAGD